jgi:uncharacterized membrane-anchored protein
MKNKPIVYLIAILFPLFLSSCSQSFTGSVFVFGFKDALLYVGIAFVLAVIIALKTKNEKRKQAFWIWFILSLLLTPLAGFMYLIYLFTKSSK